jgi:hypothetical protein
MKYFSLFLVSCFLLQSFAWAGPKESLKATLDNYQYAVTVDWDQKDQAQLQNLKAQFSAELNQLIEEENLSLRDVTEFIQENSNELQIDAQTLALLSDNNGQLNLERAQEMLEHRSNKMYAQGSSWSPVKVLIYGLIAVAVFEIVTLILTQENKQCPNPIASHPLDVPYTCVY